MNGQARPRQAATVILLRRIEPKGFEVFLTRRPEGMPFLGGMYCFPGGAVTREDCAPRMMERCRGLDAAQVRATLGARVSPRQAWGFWIAAVRELFEETGVLLAVTASGARATLENLAEKHRALAAESGSFRALLERDNLYCDLSSLGYFAHWQTPADNPVRFDTRFFVALLPPDQIPLATSEEVMHSVWLTPELAMLRCGRGELPMIFPTFASLRTLADFESVESVVNELSGRFRRRSAVV